LRIVGRPRDRRDARRVGGLIRWSVPGRNAGRRPGRVPAVYLGVCSPSLMRFVQFAVAMVDTR
jgi:hypothetical protein